MDITELQKAGINYPEGLSRFCNQTELYEKFLLQFLEDPTFDQLSTFLSEENIVQAYKSAHTLKGMSGNLSLTDFYNNCCGLVDALREHQVETIREHYQRLLDSYKRIQTALKKF